MTITICGSIKFIKEMNDWKKLLEAKGFEVFSPAGEKTSSKEENRENKIKNNRIIEHYQYIRKSEGVLILNYEKNGVPNYIGGNALMEMAFAFSQNKDIFLLNPIPDMPYSDEIIAMKPIIINNDIEKITEYYNNLPQVFLSSESVIKVKATSLALREYNLGIE